MAFNLLPIIKLLSKSGSIATTVNNIIRQYNIVKNTAADQKELQKALQLQASINEQLEQQINLLQTALIKLQKSLKTVLYIVFTALLISVAALLIGIL